MIVCLCNVVSETELDDVIEGGADSVEAVGDACGAGTDCGSCVASIAKRLACARRAAVHARSEQRLEEASAVMALGQASI
jgi:bacterioferritin-associated ferredoxin